MIVSSLVVSTSSLCRRLGLRNLSSKLLEFAIKFLGRNDCTCQLVIDYFVLNRFDLADKWWNFAVGDPNAFASFRGQHQQMGSYLHPANYDESLSFDLEQDCRNLAAKFAEQPNLLALLPPILFEASDLILVSNGLAHLSKVDCELIRKMNSPIFVFCNHANPDFRNFLKVKDMLDIPHLLIAGKNGLVSKELRILYKEHGAEAEDFKGCMLRNGVKYPNFRNNYLDDVLSVNADIDFYLIDPIVTLIEDSFSHIAKKYGGNSLALPSIGWISVALLCSLSHAGSNCNLFRRTFEYRTWTIGFNLNPSYLFETHTGRGVHDFLFEAMALKVRFKTGSICPIGKSVANRRQSPPPSTRLTNRQMWSK